MIGRLLNLLMATLLITAGPSAAWAALVPSEPSCCGSVCPCPLPSRPAPQSPGTPAPVTAPAPAQDQAQAKAKPRGPEPKPWFLPIDARVALASEPLPASEIPDPPNATERQSRLGLFRK